MRRTITALWVDESGARALDSAMTAAMAAAAVIAAMTAAGVELEELFQRSPTSPSARSRSSGGEPRRPRVRAG